MSWFDDIPIERKLRLAMLITSSLALVVACGVFLAVEYIGYRRNVTQTVRTLAQVTADNSTAAIAFADRPGARQTLDTLKAEPQIVGAALFDQEGEIFALYSENTVTLPQVLPAAVPERIFFSGGFIDSIQPVVEDGRRLGTLYLRVTLKQMYERMQVYGVVVLGVLAASFIVAWLVASLLQRTIARPLLELAGTAGAVARGADYSLRARQYGRDELGQLTMAFNIMLEQTQASVKKVAEARDQAVAASRAKDEFLAALSHELRTPLNPVLMLASDAAQNPDLPHAVRDDFAKIAKHVTLEARLIDDLLDLTRITRGKLSLDLRTCDVHAILRDALATVGPDLDAKKLSLSCGFAATEHIVHADAVRLQQVFWNVLKNSVKFTPPGGNIAVTTQQSASGEGVIVTLTDTGIGMTAGEVARAFEAFSQGEHGENGGSHRFGGLGLGLAITRTIVEMHSGTIVASSGGRNRGSVFVIELPIQRGGSLKSQAACAGGGTEETAGKLCDGADGKTETGDPRKTRVLVVEDHAATRLTLARLLERRGFEVVAAGTLEEARAAARRCEFDLIVSDIGLPDGSGYALMSELREKRPDLPGVALSGYGMEDDVSRSKAAGFAMHLTKPIDVKRLDEVIAGLVPGTSRDPKKS